MTTVTAIMPTRGRQKWAAQALECFLAQSYPAKLLLIVDDSDDPSFPIAPKYPNVSHIFLNERMTIPNKRNFAARLVTSELIAHFDSDDWSAPNRLAEQVSLLEESDVSIVGYHSLIFYSADFGAWKYCGRPYFPMGTSFTYKKAFWESHQFTPDPQRSAKGEHVGEDNQFTKAARLTNQVISLDGGLMQIARIHSGNTSEKEIFRRECMEWKPWTGGLPEGFVP